MAASVESTKSVLDQMTAGIMGRKATAAARLTPVGGEVPVAHALPRTPAAFPNDQPQEVVEGTIIILERQITHLQEVVTALRGLASRPAENEPVDLDEQRRARERAADERVAHLTAVANGQAAAVDKEEREAAEQFKTDFAAKAAAAQTATFTRQAPVADGWVCPEHAVAVVKTSRKGREYRACPSCDEFERLA